MQPDTHNIETSIGTITGMLASILLYKEAIVSHMLNSGFVVVNTLLAFSCTYALKKAISYFEKRKKNKSSLND